MKSMAENISRKLFVIKGNASGKCVWPVFWQWPQVIAKPKKNMENVDMSQKDRVLLQKMDIIESVNDELKNICKVQCKNTKRKSFGQLPIQYYGRALGLWLLP